MVKSCIDGYSIQNNRNNWWRNKFCVHNIREMTTLSKNIQKKRFALLKIFTDNPPYCFDGFQFIVPTNILTPKIHIPMHYSACPVTSKWSFLTQKLVIYLIELYRAGL